MLSSRGNNISHIAKLPKIELPTFSGDYKEWPSFKDLFTSCVGNREDLTNATKLQFLKGALKDEAATIIKHLETTEANYNEAWDKLVRRYDKKRHIISSFIKTFINQPSITTSHQNITVQLRRIVDTSDQVIRGIDVLGIQARSRDPWLIHLILTKLDAETKREWAESTSNEAYPTFKTFIEFLTRRCDALETCDVMKRNNTNHQIKNLNVNVTTCIKCNNSHYIFKCPEFKSMKVTDRRNLVEKHSLCFNCLTPGHVAQKCNSKNRCHYCNQLHHSSLHIHSNDANGYKSSRINHNSISTSHTEDHNTTTQLHLNTLSTATIHNNITILPTALVYAKDISGHIITCRVFLDSGSQATFITEDCVKRLGVRREPAKIIVRGLSSSKSLLTRGKVTISLHSRTTFENSVTVSAYILERLTSQQPANSFNFNYWKAFKDYTLADPAFNTSQRIDIIIGADYFFKIVKDGQVSTSSTIPSLQNTIFGYIIAGQMSTQHQVKNTASFHINVTDIDSSLRKFWELEEIPHNQEHLTEEEKYCESFFVQTHTVDRVTNRYMVRLPFKQDDNQLSQSIHIATSCFNTLERKFSRNHHLLNEYKTFMEEYERLGHMEPIPKDKIHTNHEHAYLPHHAVFKPATTTTKVRVVFNGSSPTSNGISLNQKLMSGPKVQRDLIPILLSFRSFNVAIVADIEKMYRQILVHPDDRNYQRIVWRKHESHSLNQFWLTTVTYGTASAPFLATRALKQLTVEFKNQYPLAKESLKNNFYVDDFLGGALDDKQAINTYEELTLLLAKRGFQLRKWSSNSTNFMKYVQPEHKSNNTIRIDEHSGSLKVLGLKWIPEEDCFSFDIALSPNLTPTKRNILSESSKVFDPLGLIAPVTVLFKIILQQLWLARFDWDDICNEIGEKWLKLREELILLQHLRVPRYLNNNAINIQLHGFADASESAYSAVIYCRAENIDYESSVRIIISKTKVSPIKQLSIPRLELCAATLLSKLMHFVQSTLKIDPINCFAWTDSTVVLSWLSSHPRKWKSFVGNRTSIILSILPRSQWCHVESSQNPADIASRGMRPGNILKSELWWNGPTWLKNDWSTYRSKHNLNNYNYETDIETRNNCTDIFFASVENDTLSLLFTRFSKLSTILHVICRCFQFITNASRTHKMNKRDEINEIDIDKAYRSLILWTQSDAFSNDIKGFKINIKG